MSNQTTGRGLSDYDVVGGGPAVSAVVNDFYVRVLGGLPRVFVEYVDGGSLKSWISSGKLYEGSSKEVIERILRSTRRRLEIVVIFASEVSLDGLRHFAGTARVVRPRLRQLAKAVRELARQREIARAIERIEGLRHDRRGPLGKNLVSEAALVSRVFEFALGPHENGRRAPENGLAALHDLEDFVIPPGPDDEPDHFDIYQNYEVESGRRDDLRRQLEEDGIRTIIQWAGKPVHQFDGLGLGDVHLPYTDRLFERCFLLPMNTSLHVVQREIENQPAPSETLRLAWLTHS